MIQVGSISYAEHQTDSATVKKSHGRRRLKKKSHAEDVAIESDRAFEVFYINEDLSNSRQGRANWYWVAHDFAPLDA
jgi:hypothetical protein